LPEVVSRPWNVPAGIESACILVLVESADDPIDPAFRQANETRIWMLVPNIRQMGLRNVQVVPSIANMNLLTAFNVANFSGSDSAVDLILSQDLVANQESVDLLLPKEGAITSKGLALKQASNEFKQAVKLLGEKRTQLWQAELAANQTEGAMQYKLSALRSRFFALMFNGKELVKDQPSSRLSLLAKENGVITGGITYVFRR